MGKVIYRLPSKGTQYGYAEYHFDWDGDPYTLGTEYRDFVTKFVAGEAAAQKAASLPKEVYEKPLTQDEAVKLISDELGASVYDEPVEEEAPEWEAPPPAPSGDDWDF